MNFGINPAIRLKMLLTLSPGGYYFNPPESAGNCTREKYSLFAQYPGTVWRPARINGTFSLTALITEECGTVFCEPRFLRRVLS